MTSPHDPAVRNALYSLSLPDRQVFLDSSFQLLNKSKEEITNEHDKKCIGKFIDYLKTIYFQKTIPESWFLHMVQLYNRHSFFLTWLATIPKPS